LRAELVNRVSGLDRVVEELKKASENVGAICIFLGVVRGISEGKRVLRLEYEAHEKLAPKILLRLLKETKAKYGILDGVIEHKVGSAEVGEPVMCVAVASEHRLEGLRALMELVDRIKQEAPIWKKEVTEEGGRWVEEGRPEGPLIKLKGVLEAEVNVDTCARELIVKLGLPPEEVLVMKEGRVLEGHEEIRRGELVKIVPVGLLLTGGGL